MVILLKRDEVMDTAGKYLEGSKTIDELLQMLDSEQQKLEENWEGGAFDSFADQYDELKPKIQDFSELLSDINEQLKNADEIESYRIWDDVINKIYDDVDLDCFTKDEEELAEERLADYYYEI